MYDCGYGAHYYNNGLVWQTETKRRPELGKIKGPQRLYLEMESITNAELEIGASKLLLEAAEKVSHPILSFELWRDAGELLMRNQHEAHYLITSHPMLGPDEAMVVGSPEQVGRVFFQHRGPVTSNVGLFTFGRSPVLLYTKVTWVTRFDRI